MTATVKSETLSDGSIIYSVHLWDDEDRASIVIPAITDKDAYALAVGIEKLVKRHAA